MSVIKVVIADDIPILRQGLEAALSQDSEIRVAGSASNGKEAFELCVKQRTRRRAYGYENAGLRRGLRYSQYQEKFSGNKGAGAYYL